MLLVVVKFVESPALVSVGSALYTYAALEILARLDAMSEQTDLGMDVRVYMAPLLTERSIPLLPIVKAVALLLTNSFPPPIAVVTTSFTTRLEGNKPMPLADAVFNPDTEVLVKIDCNLAKALPESSI